MSQRRNNFLLVGLGVADFVLQFFLRNVWGVANGRFGIFVPAVVLVGLIWTGEREKRWWWKLMVVGGIVNLVHKIMFGSVWDYICFPMINLWVNGADLLITLGVFMLIYEHVIASYLGGSRSASHQ